MSIDDRPPARFLASVTSLEEARIVLSGGADIIDCKDPRAGALGALPPAIVSAIRDALPRAVPVSATIGDLPLEPGIVAAAVGSMAAAGADFVKIGFFAEGDVDATLAALAERSSATKLIAVLLADEQPDLSLVPRIADAGFSGVMLDTAAKDGRTLLDAMPTPMLAAFVADARAAGLMSGLAGSLRLGDIPALQRIWPDVLGFRGALCHGAAREAALDPAAVASVRKALNRRPRFIRREAMAVEVVGADADGGR